MASEAQTIAPSPLKLILWTFAIGSFTAALYMANALIAIWRHGTPHPPIEIVTRLMALFWLWALLAPLAWRAAEHWPIESPHLVRRIALHFAIGLGFWLVHSALFWGLLNLRAWYDIAPLTLGIRWPPPHFTQLVVLIDTDLAIYAMIVAAATTWRNHARAIETRTWRDRVDSRRSTALLEALRRQLRPHFVLNALNMALSELATRPRRARDVLNDLAALLESTDRLEGHLVDLDTELEIVRAHAAIEQARFSDRLAVKWTLDVPPGAVKVPPFAVQTLFENAVRHGLERTRGPFTIDIEARSTAAGTRIRVRDSGGSIAPRQSRGAGIALDNLRTRLALLFGDDAALRLSVEEGWTVAQLDLPSPPLAAAAE